MISLPFFSGFGLLFYEDDVLILVFCIHWRKKRNNIPEGFSFYNPVVNLKMIFRSWKLSSFFLFFPRATTGINYSCEGKRPSISKLSLQTKKDTQRPRDMHSLSLRIKTLVCGEIVARPKSITKKRERGKKLIQEKNIVGMNRQNRKY